MPLTQKEKDKILNIILRDDMEENRYIGGSCFWAIIATIVVIVLIVLT